MYVYLLYMASVYVRMEQGRDRMKTYICCLHLYIYIYIYIYLFICFVSANNRIISGDENIIAFGECMVQHHIENFIEKPE